MIKKKDTAHRKQALRDAARVRRFPSVFISYSRGDRDTARALAEDLMAAGVPVWWDREIFPGDDFHDAIVEALEKVDVVIVIWSETAVKSRWVRDEARRADKLDKLIMLHVPDFDRNTVPLGFGDYQCESIEDRQRLIEALARQGAGLAGRGPDSSGKQAQA